MRKQLLSRPHWLRQVEPSSRDGMKLSLDATVAALAGLGLAWLFYHKRRDLPAKLAAKLHGVYNLLSNKYYVDEFYGAAIIQARSDARLNVSALERHRCRRD